MNPSLRNIAAVARREFVVRGRTRTFKIATGLLVLFAIVLALAPIGLRWLDRSDGADRVGILTGDALPGVDAVAVFDALLNAAADPLGGGTAPTDPADRAFIVEAATDLEDARSKVALGELVALVVVERTPDGDLTFELHTKDLGLARTPALIRSVATSLTIQDRLLRAGIPPIDQARLFAPPAFEIVATGRPGGGPGAGTGEEFLGSLTVGFALTILLFTAVILYGQWVAMSVAEEKSSRVMEVVLGAATPFQLLAGKVVGVGGLALLQYVLVLVPAILGLAFQGQIAALILGDGGGGEVGGLVEGLTVDLLLAFGVFFLLGFALYAVLFAGAASLVARQEDVNQIIAPLMWIAVAGYVIAAYAGTGLIPLDSPLVTVLSFVPFLSPYLMLSRMAVDAVLPVEVLVSIVLLAASLPIALWIAARLYSAGVFMYGQTPGFRILVRALRGR